MSETHPKLGQLIEGEQNRDAIHIAVAPVVAGERLDPGEHVCLTPSGLAVLAQGKSIGVVDPFLRAFVGKGDKFWLFLTPGSDAEPTCRLWVRKVGETDHHCIAVTEEIADALIKLEEEG